MMKFRRKKEKERLVEWFFLKNGGALLQELVAACDGKTNPIRSFSRDQILKATKYFDRSCVVHYGDDYTLYKGMIANGFCMIKRQPDESLEGLWLRELYNDIVTSARMSNHKNFLKLLGWCLEFPLPVLVFEYAANGVLDWQGRRIGSEGRSFLPWNVRLKIAKEIANAVTYLHTAFPKIIIHRDIKPTHVYLDQNWTAKLSDFSVSISLPEGKSRIEDRPRGTMGYADPSYLRTSFVTEYTDVYSFGVFLIVLLTGKSVFDYLHNYSLYMPFLDYLKDLKEHGEFVGIADEEKDVLAYQRSQMEAVLELSLRCCQDRPEDRPKMIEVAKELKQIESSLDARSVIPS